MVNCFFIVLLLATSAFSEDCYPIKSLQSIYSSTTDLELKTPRAVVGVIGSGVDYNHPGLAKFLAIRSELEQRLQQLEAQPQAKTLNSCEYQLLQSERGVGFPRWMDQALASPWPMDEVIQDGVLQPHLDHETRVTSRIIQGRDDIAVHFVRRMYGNQQDIFNVSTVLENFSLRGVKIVNMSFGSDCGVLPMEEHAWSQIFKRYPQIIFVISAGNSGRNLDYHDYCPAKYSRENANVISVTSVTSDGVISVNYDPDSGKNILTNYGATVDLAIRADNLPVLAAHHYDENVGNPWINHSIGWTSHAAAEVTRVITHALADGYSIDPQLVKEQLIKTSRKSRFLKDFVKSGGQVDEAAFRALIEQRPAHGLVVEPLHRY